MDNLPRFFIRVSAFLRKEIFEILRQPRLVLALIFGPFLILSLFGLGYRNEPRALRTLFVVKEGSPLGQQVKEYAPSLGPQLIFVGVTGNETAAKQKLRNGEVDLVFVVPSNAYETIRNNQQAIFTVYHHEIDPFQVDYIKVFGRVYVDEINRRLLITITGRGESQASTVKDDLKAARTNAAALRQALEQGDAVTARLRQHSLYRNVDDIALAVGATADLLKEIHGWLGIEDQNDTSTAVLNQLSDLSQYLDSLGQMGNGTDASPEVQKVTKIEEDLATLDSNLSEFQRISPNVLISPFRSSTQSIMTIQPRAVDYFAPSVIALLLQHLAVTFAALSIVRERWIGTMELFRVSPISAGETLVGKYLSYLLFSGLLAVILTLLLIYGLGVPMLGSWLIYGLVIVALIFTSLGIGFAISLLVETDSQAVQYSMIVLLTSVFFSGLFMGLQMLWQPVRVVSWALPTTYGVVLLRDIMLRDHLTDPILLAGLTAIGMGLFLLNWLLLRRAMARS
jgi:ABC-2 type transport system permease protein